MKETIIQSIQILSLVLVMVYDADAQPRRTQLSNPPEVSDIGSDGAARQEEECSLASAGKTNGGYANIRVLKSNQVLAGVSSFEEVISLLRNIQARHLCTVALHHCELTSGGMISSGQVMQQRLLVNEEALFGANDLGTLLAQLNHLRIQNICD